jgi:hypothetical protein
VRVDGPFGPPSSFLVFVFLGMILAPITLYLYAAHPSWTWMYLVNPDTVPGFAILPLVVAHLGVVVLGWYLGARLVRADKLNVAAYIAGGGGFLTLVGVVFSWNRLGRYGTFEEYEQGRALPIMEVKLGYVLVALVVGTLISVSFLAVELLRDSRRVRSR